MGTPCPLKYRYTWDPALAALVLATHGLAFPWGWKSLQLGLLGWYSGQKIQSYLFGMSCSGGRNGVWLVNSRLGVEGVSRLTEVPPTNVPAQLTAGLWAGLLLVSASDFLSHGPPLDPESPGVHGGGNAVPASQLGWPQELFRDVESGVVTA